MSYFVVFNVVMGNGVTTGNGVVYYPFPIKSEEDIRNLENKILLQVDTDLDIKIVLTNYKLL